ncbi:hypothetical protein [Rhodococcus jostii]|uniref:hypothetical protein n=1 Tax=Rhodococcus jostii TaxID=132919 RepID=UPI00362D8DE4
MSEELRKLIYQTPDVIGFLRSQIPHKSQPAADQEPTVGGKPKSKPPLNVDAIDAADTELATLAMWAQACRIPYRGWVRRVNGIPVGILYDDHRPVHDMVEGFEYRFDTGMPEPEGMLWDMQAVRWANFRTFPQLNSLFEESYDEELKPAPEPDDGQYSLEVG